MKQTSMILILNAAAALFLLESASSCAKISIDKPDQAEQYIDFATDVETKAPVESCRHGRIRSLGGILY